MKFISFHLIYCLVWLLTRLPLKWLYCISSLLYYVVYYLVPYRKRLVIKNLHNSFSSWDNKKIHSTARKFYRFFCDILVESAYFPFIRKKEIEKRFIYKNPELINDLYLKGKSIIIVMGHYGNWEWIPEVTRITRHEVIFIYKPLQNKYFDKLFIKNRERFGGKTVPMDRTLRYLMEAHQQKKLTLTYFLADQRPLKKNIHFWTTFLNQDTPIYNGPEKIARKLDMAVVYQKIQRKGRGYYEIEFSLITDDPRNTKELEIMETYFRYLQETIEVEPEYWLWTHNRWKFRKGSRDHGIKGIT